jgi:hypothetical protein
MTDHREALEAAREAIDHILPAEAAQYVDAASLADAAIAAYEQKLEAAGYVRVPREPQRALQSCSSPSSQIPEPTAPATTSDRIASAPGVGFMATCSGSFRSPGTRRSRG